MKGSHRIIVESRKVKYDFVIHRNITVITGDSGSGKTVLTGFQMCNLYVLKNTQGKYQKPVLLYSVL